MSDNKYKTFRDIMVGIDELRVPNYQREYTWQGSQIDELFEDIESLTVRQLSNGAYESTKHFLGLLVFVPQGGSQSRVYNVVDGQQRLSTLILICAAARDAIQEHSAKTKLDQSERDSFLKAAHSFESYIFREMRPFGTRTPILVPNKNDVELFKELVLQADLYENKKTLIEKKDKRDLQRSYFKAYEKIYKVIIDMINKDGLKAIVDLFVKIDFGLTFVMFVSDDEADAFNLFETLNDRGLSLSALDLIKNKVLSYSAGDPDFEQKWTDIFGRDGSIRAGLAQQFIRNYLMLRHGHINKDAVYSTFTGMVKDRPTALIFLSTLVDEAEDFRRLVDLSSIEFKALDPDLKEMLLCLNRSKVKQWQSLGLCCYTLFRKKELSEDNLFSVLNLLLNIAIRFKILNTRFNVVEKSFPALAEVITKQKFVDDKTKNVIVFNNKNDAATYVIQALEDIILSFSPYKSMETALVNGVELQDNDFAFILLMKIAIGSKKQGQQINIGLTLEHVLPESHEKNWGKIADVGSFKYSIGNMLMVFNSTNKKLSNKAFADKKDIYKDIEVWDLVSDKQWSYDKADQTTWISSFIKAREKDLCKKLLAVLKLGSERP